MAVLTREVVGHDVNREIGQEKDICVSLGFGKQPLCDLWKRCFHGIWWECNQHVWRTISGGLVVGSSLSGWSTFPFIILKNERQYTEVCILKRK